MRQPLALLRTVLPATLLVGLACLNGCVEPYAPAAISAPPAFLVVDGFINARGVSTIRLSRTAALDAQATPPAETNARLQIEQQNGANYPLTETAPGVYTSAGLTLDAGRQYRLRISTAAGSQYASDFVPVKLTPAIDAVDWKVQDSGTNFYLSTHDDTRSSQYYRWEYNETWEISSPYQPNIEYFNGAIRTIRQRLPIVCWSNSASSNILLSQTTNLSEDRVKDFRLFILPTNSNRFRIRYSVLVRQEVLTKEEYAYWEKLRKNTENIGTLYDPLPVQLTGNVNALDGGDDRALGFVGAHSMSEKRIFIDRSDLPATARPFSGYESCIPPDTINPFSRVVANPTSAEIDAYLGLIFNNTDYLPIQRLPNSSSILGKSRDCVDCRARGTAVRPSFW